MNRRAFIIHLRFKYGSKGGYGAIAAGRCILEHCEWNGMSVSFHKNRHWLVFNRYEVIAVGMMMLSQELAAETVEWCVNCLKECGCQAIRHKIIDMHGIDDMVSRRLFF